MVGFGGLLAGVSSPASCLISLGLKSLLIFRNMLLK